MSGSTSILDLPPEVRGQIFNLLRPSQSLTCRIVCPQFRHDVDNYVEFYAELDETKGNENGWFLPLTLGLRLKSVTIKRLMGQRNIFGQNPDGGFLRYPNLLRKLCVTPSSFITVENLHLMLSQSGESLREIELSSLKPPLTTSPVVVGVGGVEGANDEGSHLVTPYNFPSLRKLVISFSTLPEGSDEATEYVEAQVFRGGGLPTKINDVSIPILLLNSTGFGRTLKTLKLHVRCVGYKQVSQISALTLSLVTRCKESLTNLDFDLIQGHGVPPTDERDLADSDLELLDTSSLQLVTNLKEIRLVNSTAIGISLFKSLLSTQKNLRSVETDILPAHSSLFQQVIMNNSSTLVDLDIGDLTLDFDEEVGKLRPFDLRIFLNCKLLRRLTLDRNSMIRRPPGREDEELIHLSSLPPSLKELNINYFLVKSQELFTFLSTLRGGLNYISLTQCGDSGLYGVSGSVLQKIITLPSINYIEISPLNFNCGDDTETEKLEIILRAFDYPERYSYFQLKRRVPGDDEEEGDTSSSAMDIE